MFLLPLRAAALPPQMSYQNPGLTAPGTPNALAALSILCTLLHKAVNNKGLGVIAKANLEALRHLCRLVSFKAGKKTKTKQDETSSRLLLGTANLLLTRGSNFHLSVFLLLAIANSKHRKRHQSLQKITVCIGKLPRIKASQMLWNVRLKTEDRPKVQDQTPGSIF